MDKSKLEKYAEIQELVRKEARTIATQVYQELGTQFGVASVPFHTHNNVDSPQIGDVSIFNFLPLPANLNGVASLMVLGNQVIDNPVGNGVGNPSSVYVHPLPIIYGSGTTAAITFTGALSAGAVSGTLTAGWSGATGVYAVQFSSTETRNVTLTNGATSATWSTALVYAGTTSATVVADAVFKGGNAPQGTMVIFRNDDTNARQIWVKTDSIADPGTWLGFNADALLVGYD